MSHGQVAPGIAILAGLAMASTVVAVDLQKPTFSDTVQTTLGLRSCAIVDVELHDAPGDGVSASLVVDGAPCTLELSPHSVRSAGYQVFAADAAGTLTELTPGPVRTMRGHVAGAPDSIVAATRRDASIIAMIGMPDGRRIWVEPVGQLPGATAPTLHAVYADADVIEGTGTCAAVMHEREDLDMGQAAAPAGLSGTGPAVAELACDADYDFYQAWGEDTEARVNSVINQVNVQFERDVDITHEITTIIIRTETTYTTTDSWLLVNQFRNRWLGQHALVPRDLAHLFTGKELDGVTIGVAYDTGRVCTNGAYCLSQSDHSGGFACSTDLTAHELGHLWGAEHCPCPVHTMNSVITCANQFSSGSIASITAHRDSRECLGDSDPTTYCQATSSSSSFESISRVQLGSIDHASGASGYSSFLDVATDLQRGAIEPITITLDDSFPSDIGGAWIDWNADGDFDDANETINAMFGGVGPYVGIVTVPEDAEIAATRLRVRIQDGFSDPFVTSCGSTDFGEVEDYTINVVTVPDPCPEDLDDSGEVGFTDLLNVLSFWGICPPEGECPSDIDDDGQVGFTDLLAVLAAWGPC